GFVEQIRTNTSLIRRRLKTPRLRIEEFTIGALTKTSVEIMYIKGIANEKVVEEVRRRLNRIQTDSILESGYIEEFIEDAPFSPFSTIMRTERPDNVTGQLLEGRVAIITDNTPFVLTVPVQLNSFLMATEDYYTKYHLASFLRFIRAGALFSSLVLPSLWVAIVSFHPEALPTQLLLVVAAAKERVPFPSVVEAFLIELVFETLREAGLRLPRQIGSAISIIGGVVLGDAAVRAGLLSTPMLVVVAFTGIASFAIPDFAAANSFRLLRFPLLVLAGFLGIYGLMLGIIIILLHMTSIRSFGVPFMATDSPLIISNLKDSLVRAPWWALDTRPRLIGMKEPIRQNKGMKPQPPGDKDGDIEND
ncbi:MAG TPA: spore germination protein, partial [Clostridia bacterium]|nr:spore germination protein [Clostridia bacterium]